MITLMPIPGLGQNLEIFFEVKSRDAKIANFKDLCKVIGCKRVAKRNILTYFSKNHGPGNKTFGCSAPKGACQREDKTVTKRSIRGKLRALKG